MIATTSAATPSCRDAIECRLASERDKILSVGAKFPQFKLKARVTIDLNTGFIDIENNTYKGKWLVLFSI